MRFDGIKLRELRKARRWDQHRLAQEAREHATGITQASVSRYENGKQPTGANALGLARALDVRVEELYTEADDQEAASMPFASDAFSVAVDQLRLAAREAGAEEARKVLREFGLVVGL